MKTIAIIISFLLTSSFADLGIANTSTYPTANNREKMNPDNTGRNSRDMRSNQPLPEDQASGTSTDVELTRKIRHAITSDKSLSTNAANIKVISMNGTVTLRGPVEYEWEKTKIKQIAEGVTGVARVQDQLESKETKN